MPRSIPSTISPRCWLVFVSSSGMCLTGPDRRNPPRPRDRPGRDRRASSARAASSRSACGQPPGTSRSGSSNHNCAARSARAGCGWRPFSNWWKTFMNSAVTASATGQRAATTPADPAARKAAASVSASSKSLFGHIGEAGRENDQSARRPGQCPPGHPSRPRLAQDVPDLDPRLVARAVLTEREARAEDRNLDPPMAAEVQQRGPGQAGPRQRAEHIVAGGGGRTRDRRRPGCRRANPNTAAAG